MENLAARMTQRIQGSLLRQKFLLLRICIWYQGNAGCERVLLLLRLPLRSCDSLYSVAKYLRDTSNSGIQCVRLRQWVSSHNETVPMSCCCCDVLWTQPCSDSCVTLQDPVVTIHTTSFNIWNVLQSVLFCMDPRRNSKHYLHIQH
jgi:hypothetical protein